MDRDGRMKSDLGNEKQLQNAEKDHVTGIKMGDLPTRTGPVRSDPTPKGSEREKTIDREQKGSLNTRKVIH